MKHNLADMVLLKALHDFKCPISAYDAIVDWAMRRNSNKVICGTSSIYKFKKLDHFLNNLATRYDMTNMKPIQCNLHQHSSNMGTEITTKESCFDFNQQLLSVLHDKNIMNQRILYSKMIQVGIVILAVISSKIFMMLSGTNQLVIIIMTNIVTHMV